MIRVLVVDSHRVSRDVVRALLEMHADLEVVGEADNGLDAIGMCHDLRPDVVVADFKLSDMNALQLMQSLTQYYAVDVVILSSLSGEAYAAAASEAGAKAWIAKEQAVAELACAVRVVHRGGSYLGPPLTEETLDDYRRQAEEMPGDLYYSLTGKERQVLTLIGSGCNDMEIGEALRVSQRAVKRRRASMMRKLGLSTDSELTRYALKGTTPPRRHRDPSLENWGGTWMRGRINEAAAGRGPLD